MYKCEGYVTPFRNPACVSVCVNMPCDSLVVVSVFEWQRDVHIRNELLIRWPGSRSGSGLGLCPGMGLQSGFCSPGF